MSITPGSTLYYLIMLLIVGNVFALGIGVLMLAVPRRLKNIFKMTNRWVSTRQAARPLSVPHTADNTMLRYPQILGTVMLASAALILIKGTIFISRISVADGGEMLAQLYSGSTLPTGAWETLWLSLIILIMLGALLAAAVGIMAFFKLGVLKRWINSLNRWVSMRQSGKPLEISHYPLDNMVIAHPRLWGWMILVVALFSISVLWWFVLDH